MCRKHICAANHRDRHYDHLCSIARRRRRAFSFDPGTAPVTVWRGAQRSRQTKAIISHIYERHITVVLADALHTPPPSTEPRGRQRDITESFMEANAQAPRLLQNSFADDLRWMPPRFLTHIICARCDRRLRFTMYNAAKTINPKGCQLDCLMLCCERQRSIQRSPVHCSFTLICDFLLMAFNHPKNRNLFFTSFSLFTVHNVDIVFLAELSV